MRNHSRLRERRVVLTISVNQETPATKLASIPELLNALIREHKDTRFDRAHLAKIGANSFDFEAVYFVTTPDYNRHMDIQQAIILRVLEAFERDEISIASTAQRITFEGARAAESELMDSRAPAETHEARKS
jgi:small-conductance mechanosensitive channel